MKKEILLSKLGTDKVTINFTKADGSIRTMLCTKSLEFIPTEQHPKGIKVPKLDENGKPIPTDIITVYDLENKGWRSFNYSKLLEVQL